MRRKRPSNRSLFEDFGVSASASGGRLQRPRSLSFDPVEWAAVRRAAFLGGRSVSAHVRAAIDGSAEPVDLGAWSAVVDAAMRQPGVTEVDDPALRRRAPRTVMVDEKRWRDAGLRAGEAGTTLSRYVRACLAGRPPQRLPRQQEIVDS